MRLTDIWRKHMIVGKTVSAKALDKEEPGMLKSGIQVGRTGNGDGLER